MMPKEGNIVSSSSACLSLTAWLLMLVAHLVGSRATDNFYDGLHGAEGSDHHGSPIISIIGGCKCCASAPPMATQSPRLRPQGSPLRCDCDKCRQVRAGEWRPDLQRPHSCLKEIGYRIGEKKLSPHATTTPYLNLSSKISE
jgi:hypothetical protein